MTTDQITVEDRRLMMQFSKQRSRWLVLFGEDLAGGKKLERLGLLRSAPHQLHDGTEIVKYTPTPDGTRLIAGEWPESISGLTPDALLGRGPARLKSAPAR